MNMMRILYRKTTLVMACGQTKAGANRNEKVTHILPRWFKGQMMTAIVKQWKRRQDQCDMWITVKAPCVAKSFAL